MKMVDERGAGGESAAADDDARSPAGAIILAAGEWPFWEPLAGRPLLAWSVAAFERAPSVTTVALDVAAGRVGAARALVAAEGWRKARVVAPAGPRRRDA